MGPSLWPTTTVIVFLPLLCASSGAVGPSASAPGARLRPILLDEGRCPLGWSSVADGQCVQLQYSPLGRDQAEAECRRMGAQLVDVADADSGQGGRALLEDLSAVLEEPWAAGLDEPTWTVGCGGLWPQWDAAQGRVLFTGAKVGEEPPDGERPAVGVRRRNGGGGAGSASQIDVVLLSPPSSPRPFICALLPLWRRVLLYEQSLLPRGAPRLEEEPRPSYAFDPQPANNSTFLQLPCSASAHPTPAVRWFRNGGEEVDLQSASSPFFVSGGSLLVPVSSLAPVPSAFHCSVSNPLGAVRSPSATLRPAFIEPFRESRLDAFALVGHGRGAGARLDCNAPTHYPRSFSYSWVRGGNYEKFVEVSQRVFISMEGTLYFAYNVKEDEDSYACTLSLPTTQSAQLGPFFRLLLPLGHINPHPKLGQPKAAHHHPHAFAPRIDDFQPQVFPEVPARGESVHLECFAYGFPAPSYRWSRSDGTPLPEGRHRLLNFGRILRIDVAQMGDSGRYKCTAQNKVGTASAEIRLHVHAPPTLLRPLTDRLVAPGQSTTFHCPIADSNGPAQLVEWFKDGAPLVPLLMSGEDRDRFKLVGSELSIDVRTSSDGGLYQCMAHNDVGSVSSSALLIVASVPPLFHSNVLPSRVFVVQGTHLSLPCLFQSSPPGTGQWTRLGVAEEAKARMKSDQDKSMPGRQIALLRLENAQLNDSGEYECEARNALGTAKKRVHVEVLPRSHVQMYQENEEAGRRRYSCEVEMHCKSAEECPEALFSWQFNDRPIRSLSGRREMQVRHREERHPAEDSLSHSEGRVVWQRSELQVGGAFAKDHVGRFACNSLFGGATADLDPMPAFVPLKLSVDNVSDSGAKLSWRTLRIAPNGQPSVKRRGFAAAEMDATRAYEVEMRTARERLWRVAKKVSLPTGKEWAGHVHLHGLEPNQRYQFRLRPASDGARPVSLSDWVRTPEAVPSQAVQNLRFRMLDDRHVLLEWNPVERFHQSAPNLRYNVSWSLLRQDGKETSAELVTAPRLVIQLPRRGRGEECVIMDVGVRPVNERGPGKVATSTVIRASSKEPQRYATDLRLESVNGTHMSLGWTWRNADPCENVIGAKIMCTESAHSGGEEGGEGEEEDDAEDGDQRPNFTRDNAADLAKNPPAQSIPSEYTQWLVHSLRPQTHYTCRVVAFDQYGRMGPIMASSVARGRTRERAPTQVTEVSYVRVKEAQNGVYAVLVDWQAVPLDEGNATRNASWTAADDRGYKIFVYVSETAEEPIVLGLSEAELHDPSRPSARIDGLRAMFFYTIQVAAYNPGGTGPPSERIPVRIGARNQQNPDLVHMEEGGSESGTPRKATTPCWWWRWSAVLAHLLFSLSVASRTLVSS